MDNSISYLKGFLLDLLARRRAVALRRIFFRMTTLKKCSQFGQFINITTENTLNLSLITYKLVAINKIVTVTVTITTTPGTKTENRQR